MRATIRRAQAGCEESRRHLIAALGPRLRRMGRYYARRSSEDCEDLVAEGWYAVFAALSAVDVEIGEPE